MDHATHVSVREAARTLGVSLNTMRKRLDRAGVVVTFDPLDRRYRLIPRDVLPTLATPADAARRNPHPELTGVAG